MSRSNRKIAASVRVGVDTGGTFTDFVVTTKSGVRLFKLASTPADPSSAIIEGLRRIAQETGAKLEEIEVVHGTTVGTNALLERRGARTALVTTAGFEDVLEIGRQTRPALYNLNATRPAPLVPAELRFGVPERIASSGKVLEELNNTALTSLRKRLKQARVEAIAVSLLFSFVNPEHEQQIVEALSSLGLPLSISHEVLREYREYERTSTVCINAYLQPLIKSYLQRLSESGTKLWVMQSSGGSISAEVAAREPVRTILSGPAGGVVGAVNAVAGSGAVNLITFDMGGTSTDVALCKEGSVSRTSEATVAGLPVAIPLLEIHTVGAGGGSIARVDAGGSLRVGPQSAGAVPGPACYGQGSLPTVTDADLALGRFGGSDLLGGDFQLDEARAREVLAELGNQMSQKASRRISPIEAALGVARVVNAGMERALRHVSVERGYDPREFTLVTFGGAGGLHAVELGRALRVREVIVPYFPGALSAFGALESDVIKEHSRTLMLEATARSLRLVERLFAEMRRAAKAALQAEGFSISQQRHELMVAARYKGQSFELEIGWNPHGSLAQRFHEAHHARYGYAQQGMTIQIVSIRLRSIGVTEKLTQSMPRKSGTHRTKRQAVFTTRCTVPVYFSKTPIRTSLYARDELPRNARLSSPCIITEYSSTTLVPPGAKPHVDEAGNLIITP